MAQTAKRAAIATLVVGGIVVLALAMWKLKLLFALLFLAFILSSAMRPAIDWLAARKIPRGVGILLHYVVIVGALVAFLWLVVPRAIDQVDNAVGSGSGLGDEAKQSTGIKHDILVGLQRRLDDLPTGSSLVDPAVEVTRIVFEVGLGIFFVLASAAYWIVEREHAQNLVCSLLPRPKRKRVRDTWDLIDAKLGTGVLAGLAVLIVRLLEDYLVIPRVLGDAVGLTPLIVIFAVTACGLLFGGFAVILAIPAAAVIATLIDVVVRDKDPAEEEVPSVIFSPADSEAG